MISLSANSYIESLSETCKKVLLKLILSQLITILLPEVRPILLAGWAEVGQRDDLDPDHGGLQGGRQRAGGGPRRAQGRPNWSVHSLTGQCDLVKDGDRVFMIRECIHSLAFFSFDTCSLFVLFHSKKVVASWKRSSFDINLYCTPFHISLTLRIWR